MLVHVFVSQMSLWIKVSSKIFNVYVSYLINFIIKFLLIYCGFNWVLQTQYCPIVEEISFVLNYRKDGLHQSLVYCVIFLTKPFFYNLFQKQPRSHVHKLLEEDLSDQDAAEDVTAPQTGVWKMDEEIIQPQRRSVCQHDQSSSRRLQTPFTHQLWQSHGPQLWRSLLLKGGGSQSDAPELSKRTEPLPRLRPAAEAPPAEPGGRPLQSRLGAGACQSKTEMQFAAPPGLRGSGRRGTALAPRAAPQSRSRKSQFWTRFDANKLGGIAGGWDGYSVQFGSGTLDIGRRSASDGQTPPAEVRRSVNGLIW